MSHLCNLSFLVVDDLPAMRRTVRGLLTELGCSSVAEAEDGAVALRMLKTGRHDFVISDINMPNMNGFDLLEAVKASDALMHIPVLLVAAEVRMEDILLAARTGAAGYVVKPFSKSTLQEKIEQIMRKQAATA